MSSESDLPFTVLVVNAGSSSLKLSLLGEGDDPIAERELETPAAQVDPAALADALRAGGFRAADAVGHRIVHGGERFREAVRVDARVRGELGRLTDAGAAASAKVARSARRRIQRTARDPCRRVF